MFLDDLQLDIQLHQNRLKLTDGERHIQESIIRSKAIADAGGLQAYHGKQKAKIVAAVAVIDDLLS